jgi:hypothetical protein
MRLLRRDSGLLDAGGRQRVFRRGRGIAGNPRFGCRLRGLCLRSHQPGASGFPDRLLINGERGQWQTAQQHDQAGKRLYARTKDSRQIHGLTKVREPGPARTVNPIKFNGL